MLIGESVPVTKTLFKPTKTDCDATKRTANILYGGTQVHILEDVYIHNSYIF